MGDGPRVIPDVEDNHRQRGEATQPVQGAAALLVQGAASPFRHPLPALQTASSTFSCDIAYSESPAASRASSGSRNDWK